MALSLGEAGRRTLAALLAAACAVVPSVFWTGTDETFVLPKLAVLWAILALGFGVIAVTLRPGRGDVWVRVPDAAVATFLALNVVAWSFSSDREQSLYGERFQHQGLLTVLLYVAFYCVARGAISDALSLGLLAAGIGIGAAAVASYALLQRVGFDPIWDGYSHGGRVFSSIGQANSLAAYLVLAIPVSAALLFARRPAVQLGVAVATLAMLVALFLTFSRAGYLGLLTAAVVFRVGTRGHVPWHRRRVWAGAAVAAAILLAVTASSASARDAMRTSWDRVSSAADRDEASVRFHRDAWTVAARVTADHPLLGTGQETFPQVFPRYSHAVLPQERAVALDAYRVESPHNVYLAIAAGTGIPALAAYLIMIAACARALFTAARTTADPERELLLVGVLAAIVGHVVTDAFITADVTGAWMFFVLLGASVAVTRQQRRPLSGS